MLIWSSQFEIGIPVIDAQHRRIVQYINQIDELKNCESDKESIKDVLASLVDYTFSHFAFEEALMEEAGYNALEEHQITHRAFENQIETLHKRFQRGEDIAAVLTDILLNWLLQHIKEDDSSYAMCVHKNILGQKPNQHKLWVKEATTRFFAH